MSLKTKISSDFLIIGSGIAGLNSALKATCFGEVILITKKKLTESNTLHAQGGIAAVLSPDDNFQNHITDTLEAGAHHNKKKAVSFMVTQGPQAINDLIQNGVPFNKHAHGELQLAREGGHSHRRIAYIGDYTGQEIENTLAKKILQNKRIKIFENTLANELLVKNEICYGVQALKQNQIYFFLARNTILATGGSGNIYKHSTNPEIATGDGIAMAYLSNCCLKDLEFIQFHPTALNLRSAPRFLISEALRGEGAILLNYQKKPFMPSYDRRADLAPRDIVARAIYQEERKGPVYLDISFLPAVETKKRFPKIYKTLRQYGLDITQNPIPITPAAHYSCGGIITNLNGQTNIKHLYAFGEVTCTGVHGSNRLASNSLLEALVFSNQITHNHKIHNQPKKSLSHITLRDFHSLFFTKYHSSSKSQIQDLNQLKNQIQTIMWEKVGIIRNRRQMKEALSELQAIAKIINNIINNGQGIWQNINQNIIEARNMCLCAILITTAALKRKTSLGCHFIEKNY